MNVLEAIQNRREITNFKDKPIPEDLLEALTDSAYLSPSGNNLLSREFILVTEREALVHLAHTTPYMPWLAQAASAIVIIGRPSISKYWLQDSSIASGYIWLTAVDLGLGAAFGAVYHAEDEVESKKRESYVRKALSIPDEHRVVAIVGFGYIAKEPKPKTLPSKSEVVHHEKYRVK